MVNWAQMLMDPNFAQQMAGSMDPTQILAKLQGASPAAPANPMPGTTSAGGFPLNTAVPQGMASIINPQIAPQAPFAPGASPDMGTFGGMMGGGGGGGVPGLTPDMIAKLMGGMGGGQAPAAQPFAPAVAPPTQRPMAPMGQFGMAAPMARPSLFSSIYGR